MIYDPSAKAAPEGLTKEQFCDYCDVINYGQVYLDGTAINNIVRVDTEEQSVVQIAPSRSGFIENKLFGKVDIVVNKPVKE